MLRVVLDTNVLLSGIAYPASIPRKILAAWRNGSVDVLLSAYILDELRRVLPRLRHRHGLTAAEIDDLVDALSIQAEIIDPLPAEEPRLHDAADELVLDTLLAALAGAAQNHDRSLADLLFDLTDERWWHHASSLDRICLHGHFPGCWSPDRRRACDSHPGRRCLL
jgi:putative PIN family toxin of toxin-antitoxin system